MRVENQDPGVTSPSANGMTKKVKAVATFRAAELSVRRTTQPGAVPTQEQSEAATESICTDHMITVSWTEGQGWSQAQLIPSGPLSLMPTASVFHYATECFEGLKLYRGFDGRLRLFRPDCNARRMVTSAARVALPTFDPSELVALMAALAAVDGPRWLPRDRPGSYLYLRPTLIGTYPQLGVQPSRSALFFLIATFMPQLDSPSGGLRLETSPDGATRAWPGGFGAAKLGANYGPSLVITQEAHHRGFHQVLWLFGQDGRCTEAGASNFCVVWRARGGDRMELVTASLDDGLVLDGVTRRSILHLVRERMAERVDVVERVYTIGEIIAAADEGRLVEAFAMGTAYFVCPVSLIRHGAQSLQIPMGEGGKGGQVALTVRQWLMDIMYGREENEWTVVVPEEEDGVEELRLR